MLALISIARSGSTFLCELLHHHPEIYSCREIFHRKTVHCREPARTASHLNKLCSTSFSGAADPAFVEFTHTRSLQFLAALRSLADGRVLSFKVFPNHLTRRQLRNLLISDRRVVKLLFKRDLLAAYVSRKKALSTNVWARLDTTEIRVSLDANEFRDYVKRTTYWFDSVEYLLKASGQKYATIHYENLVSIVGDNARLAYIVDQLRLTGIIVSSLDDAGVKEIQVGMMKQDRSPSLESKVENLPVFYGGLRRLGMANFIR